MDPTSLILIVVLVVVLVYFVMIYKQLVQVKQNAAKAWAHLDVLLRHRHDDVLKLVETCRPHMAHDRQTLPAVLHARSQVAEARMQRDVAALGHAEGRLRGALGTLFAVAEAYPGIASDETFEHLQARIASLENGIADRRELYNESVNVNNVRIEQFPDSVVAAICSFKPLQLLKFPHTEATRRVDVKELFHA